MLACHIHFRRNGPDQQLVNRLFKQQVTTVYSILPVLRASIYQIDVDTLFEGLRDTPVNPVTLQRLNANVLLKYTKSMLFYFFILSLTYNAFHGEEGVYLISTEVVILRQTHGAKVSGQEVSSKWE